MSYFGGGGGGGWVPPVPPPFFNQPPPGMPIPFFDPSAYPHSVQPDYQQQMQGYQYVPSQVPPQVVQESTPVPVSASTGVQPSSVSSALSTTERSSERGQKKPMMYASSSRYSPPSRSERSDHRSSPDSRSRGYRNDGDDRYSRQTKESMGDSRLQKASDDGGEERARPRERDGREKALPPPDKPKVDIDALLKDERLRNVLFAGISKATAKLEQSLQDKEQPDSESKSQLFPSASNYQKPRSILKRKEDEAGDSKTLSNLSALEKTLQMLRGKQGEIAAPASSSKSSSDQNAPKQGALSQLSVYDEGNDEDSSYHDEKQQSGKRKSNIGNHPFWTAPSELETSKRESDSFDVKEKMFEEWRQSIGGKRPESKPSPRESKRDSYREVEPAVDKAPPKRRELPKSGDGDNQEELDSTVQNILKSIGFNFDLSKRMQELARKKKRQEDEDNSGIQNASASFMDRGDFLVEELKASLLQSGSDISRIENLIREARASSQGSRYSSQRMRSPSPDDRRSTSYGRDVRGASPISRQEYLEREQEQRTSRDRARSQYKSNDQWDRVSPDRYSSSQRISPPRRSKRERDSLSPAGGYGGDRGNKQVHRVSERFRDDVERNEYFYPEKEFVDSPLSVPLLTSLSSRKHVEDLTGGLLKQLRVENFRVMSRPTHEAEDDVETRRIILPAKSDRRDFSPRDRDVSPVRTVTRKRSASPMPLLPHSKERRLSPSYGTKDMEFYRQRSPDDRRSGRRSPDDRHSGRQSSDDRLSGRRSPVDHYTKSVTSSARRPISDFDNLNLTLVDRKKSPRRSPSPRRRSKERRSRSPTKRRSRSRNRSKSPHRARSPRRRRSPSPSRGRSKSPNRKRRSPVRRSPARRSPARRSPARRSPARRSPARRSPARRSPARRSPARRSPARPSFGRKRSPVKRVERPKERNRQESSDEKAKPKDLSKIPDQERKAHLQKLLAEKDVSIQEKKGNTEAAKEAPKKEPDMPGKIMDEFDGVTKMTKEVRAQVLIKIMTLSADEQSKSLKNISLRKSKISSLKQDLEQLKKAQNELMRKSQRSGLGNKDPQLTANNLTQLEVEKEIDRLSAPDLGVQVESNLEDRLSTIRLKAQGQSKAVESTTKTKTPKAELKLTKKSEGSTAEESSWTSVDVKEEALPEIKDKKDNKSDNKKGNKKDKRSSAPVKPKKNIYYEYVDAGNHWCRHCGISCNALDQYLCHCHGKKHMAIIGTVDKPWKIKDEPSNKRRVGQSQTRRIKGSEMLFPVFGYYCSLCTVFCGDIAETEAHLKSDKHYEAYLEYLRQNPGYEKKLLLEKSKGKKQNGPFQKYEPFQKDEHIQKNEAIQKNEPAPQPALLPDAPRPPTPGTGKKRKSKKTKSLRQKEAEEEKEAGNVDNTVPVDMEIDDDEERDDDVDVLSKVPKMTGKPSSLASILSGLQADAASGSNSGVEMKAEIKDEVTSLGEFLTIAKDSGKSKISKKAAKLPVITKKQSELDLSSIPVPEPKAPGVSVELEAIPMPESTLSTVKSLQQIQDEEKKMMGIDVDAEEEKPLAPIKPPPPLSETQHDASAADKTKTKNESVKEEMDKPKSLDSLFDKVVKHKVKQTTKSESDVSSIPIPMPIVPKAIPVPKLISSGMTAVTEQSGPDVVLASLGSAKLTGLEPASEMEKRFEREIKEKLEKEKQKLLKQQERKEMREKRLQEKNLPKKKVVRDSSSEEETESDEEEDETVVKNPDDESSIVNSSDKTNNTEVKDVVSEEHEYGLREGEADIGNSIPLPSDTSVEKDVASEGQASIISSSETNMDTNELSSDIKMEIEESKETIITVAENIVEEKIKVEEDISKVLPDSSSQMDTSEVIVTTKRTSKRVKKTPLKKTVTQVEKEPQTESQNLTNQTLDTIADANTDVQQGKDFTISDQIALESLKAEAENLQMGFNSTNQESSPMPKSPKDTEGKEWELLVTQNVTVNVLQTERDLLDAHTASQEINLDTVKPSTDSHTEEEKTIAISETNEKMNVASENEKVLVPEQVVEEKSVKVEESLSQSSDPVKQETTPKVAVKTSAKKKGKTPTVKQSLAVKALCSESDLLGVLSVSPDTLLKPGHKKTSVAKKPAPKSKRGGKIQTTQKSASETVSEADEDFSMDDFVVLSEVTEEEEGVEQIPRKEDVALSQKEVENKSEITEDVPTANVVLESISGDVPQSINLENVGEKSNETVKEAVESRPVKSGGRGRSKSRERSGVSPQLEKSGEENTSNKQAESCETNENNICLNSDLVVLSEVTNNDDIGAESTTVMEEKKDHMVVELVENPVDMVQPTVGLQSKGVKTGGRGKGKKVTAKLEKTPEVSGQDEQKNDDSCIEEGKAAALREKTPEVDLQSEPKDDVSCVNDGKDEKETDDAGALPAAENKTEIPAPRTRRSGRVAAGKASTTPKVMPKRQTRSRGKKNAPEVKSEENKDVMDESATEEIIHVEPEEEPTARMLRSREPETRVVNVEESNNEILGSKDEQESANEEMPTLIPEAVQEDVDSDATVTEETECVDSFDVNTEMGFGNMEAMMTAVSATSSHPKDPPMSGVVIETELSESRMVTMEEEDELQMPTDASELGSLPTAGLSLGLEDDSNSIDFTMVEEGN